MPTACSTDGLAKLKPRSGQWTAMAVPSQHQVHRTENGYGWPGQ